MNDPERNAVIEECQESGGCGESPCLHGLLYDANTLLDQVRTAIENRLSSGRESVLRTLSTRIAAHLIEDEN